MNIFHITRLLAIIICLSPGLLWSQYSISGQLVDSEQKYKYITLELVPSVNGLTSANINNIVKQVPIDTTGYFIFEGDDLPEEPMLYRLSLQKKGDVLGISTGSWKNYIHIVLDKQSTVELIGCEDISKTFGFCSLSGSMENRVLQDLYDNVLYKFWGDYKDVDEVGSELKKDLVYQNHIDLLKTYCDTSNFLFPSLVAYKHIKTEIDKDYRAESPFYNSFLNKVMDMQPESPYAIELKKELYIELDILHGHQYKAMSTLEWAFLIAILALGIYIIVLRRKLSQLNAMKASPSPIAVETRIKSLSKKEFEVLQHIKDGKSNKEIASLLYIEVNTVKSHISKIYQKLGVKSRKEALEMSL